MDAKRTNHKNRKNNSKKPSINRRRFVRAIGAAGGTGAFGISGLGSAVAQNTEGKSTHLSGAEKNQAVNEAISHSESQILIHYMSEKGFEIQDESGSAVHLSPEDVTPYTFVTIQFEKESGSTNKSVSLLWTDHPSEGGATVSSLDTGTITQYDVENGEITEEVSYPSPTTYDNLPGGGGGGGECVYFEERCTNINWTCLAGAFVTFGSCGWAFVTRDISGVLACLASLGVAFGQYIDQEGCNPCDSTDMVGVNLCRFPDGTCCGPGSP